MEIHMISNTDPLVGIVSPTSLFPSHFRRVAWGAIIAGMVIAVVVQLVFSLLGAGIGLSTVDPTRYNTPDAASFGLGTGIWWIVSSVIALFAGGWVAGRLSDAPEKTEAVLHGLLTWGLATLVTVYLLASIVGSVMRGGASVVGKTADVAASSIGAVAGPAVEMARDQLAASGISLESMKAQVQKLMAQTGNPALQPSAVANQASAAAGQLTSAAINAGSSGNTPSDDLRAALEKIISSGKDTIEQVDRNSVVNVVMARTGVSRAEAEQRTDAWISQYHQARVQWQQKKMEAETTARQMADDAASASSKAALGAVAALVLSALAAAFGGMYAGRRVAVVTQTHHMMATAAG
jgi:hypothetical protein